MQSSGFWAMSSLQSLPSRRRSNFWLHILVIFSWHQIYVILTWFSKVISYDQYVILFLCHMTWLSETICLWCQNEIKMIITQDQFLLNKSNVSLTPILTAKMGYQFEFQIGTNSRFNARHLFNIFLIHLCLLGSSLKNYKIVINTLKWCFNDMNILYNCSMLVYKKKAYRTLKPLGKSTSH